MAPKLRASTKALSTRQNSPSAGTKRSAGILDYEKPGLKRKKVAQVKETRTQRNPAKDDAKHESDLAETKWRRWSAHATTTPYADFGRPTPDECEAAHRVLTEMHGEAVKAEFEDSKTPEIIPHVLDAVVIAILSQATSWSNAKRAMDGLKQTYGSIFAYHEILSGGAEKLQEALRCGGLHIRKSMLITSILEQVQERHGTFDLDYLFASDDDDVMKELLSYKGVGPKSASVVKTWCLQRQAFTVDTHIYRISGLWGWRPQNASVSKTQAHLDALIPKELQFDLHFLLLQHGRTCPACRGGAKGGKKCEARIKIQQGNV